MSTIHAQASAAIDARPQDVYAILADYRVGHPAILPKPYFTRIAVEQGGQGAGTVVYTELNVYGRKFEYHMLVTEPQPGRVLVETDARAGVITTFTVEALGAQQARVTIASELPASRGVMGWLERLMTPAAMRRIYQAELQQLAGYARSQR